LVVSGGVVIQFRAEEEAHHMTQFIKIASTAHLAPGDAKCVEAAGKKISAGPART
jgi:hypothetical protein